MKVKENNSKQIDLCKLQLAQLFCEGVNWPLATATESNSEEELRAIVRLISVHDFDLNVSNPIEDKLIDCYLL